MLSAMTRLYYGRRGRGLGCRELDGERRLGLPVAVHPQTAAMGVHDVLGDGETETGPLRLRGEERLKDPLADLRGNPYPGVVDHRPDHAAVGRLDAGLHRRARG